MQDEKKCVSCHVDKQSPHSAHDGINNEKPADATAISATAAAGSVHNTMAIRCTDCHQEHDASLLPARGVQNHLCNTCHQVQQKNITQHTSFGRYPYLIEPSIRFDHNKHLEKHLADKKTADGRPYQCTSCHIADAQKSHIGLQSFAVACASCHEKSLKAADPVVLLSLPVLDKTRLATMMAGNDHWPDDGDDTVFSDAALQLIQSASNNRVHALALHNIDVSDLSKADATTLALVADVVSATRQILSGLSLANQSEHFADASLDSLREQAGAAGSDATTGAKQLGLSKAEVTQALALLRITPDISKNHLQINEAGIRYALAGHGDAFISRWFGRPTDMQLDRFAPEACSRCHALTRADGNGINWGSDARSVPATSSVNFSHSQHLLAVGDKGCATCHSKESPATAEPAADETPATAPAAPATQSGLPFKAMSTKVCAACHTPSNESGQCSTCHRYHRDATVANTALPKSIAEYTGADNKSKMR